MTEEKNRLIIIAEGRDDEQAHKAMSILRDKYDPSYCWCLDCDYIVVKEADCCMNRREDNKIKMEDKELDSIKEVLNSKLSKIHRVYHNINYVVVYEGSILKMSSGNHMWDSYDKAGRALVQEFSFPNEVNYAVSKAKNLTGHSKRYEAIMEITGVKIVTLEDFINKKYGDF